eukprot:scaffold7119_cov33-Phaeocystis_antarctica.AAC.1
MPPSRLWLRRLPTKLKLAQLFARSGGCGALSAITLAFTPVVGGEACIDAPRSSSLCSASASRSRRIASPSCSCTSAASAACSWRVMSSWLVLRLSRLSCTCTCMTRWIIERWRSARFFRSSCVTFILSTIMPRCA